tara:strand:- start:184 stop:483 length:300 start_codon:yes stop_codon:yes gene_type:complete
MKNKDLLVLFLNYLDKMDLLPFNRLYNYDSFSQEFLDSNEAKINYTRCCTELPNIYEKEFNSERIKIINTLSDNYNVDKSTVRSLFCDGADWYKQKLTK